MSVEINDNYSEYVSQGTTTVTPEEGSFGYNYSKPSPEFNALNVSVSTQNCEEKNAALRLATLTDLAINKNDPKAQVALALCYKDGKQGVVQNTAIAITLMQRAAEQGYPEALYRMGVYHFDSRNICREALLDNDLTDKECDELKKLATESWLSSVEFFKKAADGGHPKAQHIMARINLNSLIEDASREKGIEYLTKAAKQEHPNAIKDLAELNIKEFLGLSE